MVKLNLHPHTISSILLFLIFALNVEMLSAEKFFDKGFFHTVISIGSLVIAIAFFIVGFGV